MKTLISFTLLFLSLNVHSQEWCDYPMETRKACTEIYYRSWRMPTPGCPIPQGRCGTEIVDHNELCEDTHHTGLTDTIERLQARLKEMLRKSRRSGYLQFEAFDGVYEYVKKPIKEPARVSVGGNPERYRVCLFIQADYP